MRETDIAIVGMGAMLPGALDVASSWNLIVGKQSAIVEIPPSRWDASLYYDPDPKAPYRTNSKLGSFLPDDIGFKSRDFSMPPILREHLDPTQQLALLTARQTLQSINAADRQPRHWAVLVGNLLGGSWKRGEQWIRTQHEKTVQQLRQSPVYQRHNQAERQALEEAIALHLPWSTQPNMTPDSLPGLLGNLIASRISHYFNLLGPNFTVDAACATSLAAVEQAIIGLRERRFDAALCGGVDRIMDASSFIGFSKMGVLSPTHSAPFDASANGFIMGEGAAMFVLKRLTDAIQEGDMVYAVIRGIGSSTDGPGRSIAAPNPEGQQRSIQQAYADAEVDPVTVDLIECHGTSTPIGDPTEIAALRPFWQHRDKSRPVSIGSIKSNLGHLKGAAGAAALLKATLALHHKTLPPQINFQTPNPHCEFPATPFRVQTEPEPWETPGTPRRCGVSAFGFGGINYHVVLEEFPMSSDSVTGVTSSTYASTLQPAPLPLGMKIVALGAADRKGLAQEARRVIDMIDATGSSLWLESLRAAPTLSQNHCRAAFYAESTKEQRKLLEMLAKTLEEGKSLQKLEAKGISFREGAVEPGRIAFMFPGQGSQYIHMLSELKERFPIVQETLDEADEVMANLLPKPLSEYLSPPPEVDESDAFFALLQTEVLQPAVLAADYAMWRLLSPLMPVELVMGHSLGEYGAAIAAGVFSFADALRIVSARGEAIAAVADEMDDVGVMIGVGADAKTVQELLDQMEDRGYVIVANKNCNTQTIIAGATDATMKAAELLQEKGYDTIQLPVSHAFHSSIVSPASPYLLEELKKIDIKAPKLTILSNVTAEPYPTDGDASTWIRDTLSVHLAEPVEWQAMTEWAYENGFRTFVEAGPKRALSSFVRDVLSDKEHQSYFSSHPKFGEINSLGRMLSALTADGLLPYGTERPVTTTSSVSNGNGSAQAVVATTITDPKAAPAVAAKPAAATHQTAFPFSQVAAPQAAPAQPVQPVQPAAHVYAQAEPQPVYAQAAPQGPQMQAPVQPQVPTYPAQSWPGYAPQMPMQGWMPQNPYAGMMPGMPMQVMPPQAMLFDPGFWQFVASQGPWIMQQLVTAYQTRMPSYPMMPMTPTMPVHAMPTPWMQAPQQGYPMVAQPQVPVAPQQPAQPVFAAPAQPQAPTWTAPQTQAALAAPTTPPGWGATVASTQPAVAAPVAAPVATPAQPVQAAQPAATTPASDNLEQTILALVAERTGYDVEELDLDEHLEADLGIDSIRQVEVMAELRDSMKLPRDDSFKITDYPTLRSLIQYVKQNVPREGRDAGTGAAATSSDTEPSG